MSFPSCHCRRLPYGNGRQWDGNGRQWDSNGTAMDGNGRQWTAMDGNGQQRWLEKDDEGLHQIAPDIGSVRLSSA